MLLLRWDTPTAATLPNDYGTVAPTWPALGAAYPPVNVREDGETVYVEAELPGIHQEDVAVVVTEGNQLTIEGERRPAGPEGAVWHRRERGFGRFGRVVLLPVAVDADKVEARLEHGVLLVTLPKAEAYRPRRIPVTAD